MAYLKIIGIGIYFNIHVPLCILNFMFWMKINMIKREEIIYW